MQYTLEAILKGQEKILEYYEHAKTKWEALFADQKAPSWSEWIGHEEKTYFEPECGGMFIGREVMAWSGFALLYSTQFGWEKEKRALAQKLALAFADSGCSDETKAAADKAALLYGVERAPETANRSV